MLYNAQLLKHKLLIGLLYGCGLRCAEVCNLQLTHLDFHRKLIHIVQSKGNKDRYIPLSTHLIRGIQKYLDAEQPKKYLFEGSGNPEKQDFDGRYSQRGLQWTVKSTAKQAGISKEVHTHMFRHTYATHLLEDGVNIVTVQKMMGHANINSALVYLHVCTVPEIRRTHPHVRPAQQHDNEQVLWVFFACKCLVIKIGALQLNSLALHQLATPVAQ